MPCSVTFEQPIVVIFPPNVAVVFVIDALVGEEIVGGEFAIVTANVCGEPIPQPFVAATVIFPFWPRLPVVTVIELVPSPAVIDQPVGTVQV
ncbi:hypothetical protein D3C84_892740 [compost metagenome]